MGLISNGPATPLLLMGRLVTNTGSTRRIDAERFLTDVLQAGHLNRSALVHTLSWGSKDEQAVVPPVEEAR